MNILVIIPDLTAADFDLRLDDRMLYLVAYCHDHFPAIKSSGCSDVEYPAAVKEIRQIVDLDLE